MEESWHKSLHVGLKQILIVHRALALTPSTVSLPDPKGTQCEV